MQKVFLIIYKHWELLVVLNNLVNINKILVKKRPIVCIWELGGVSVMSPLEMDFIKI